MVKHAVGLPEILRVLFFQPAFGGNVAILISRYELHIQRPSVFYVSSRLAARPEIERNFIRQPLAPFFLFSFFHLSNLFVFLHK